jgi:hypothetical protein
MPSYIDMVCFYPADVTKLEGGHPILQRPELALHHGGLLQGIGQQGDAL